MFLKSLLSADRCKDLRFSLCISLLKDVIFYHMRNGTFHALKIHLKPHIPRMNRDSFRNSPTRTTSARCGDQPKTMAILNHHAISSYLAILTFSFLKIACFFPISIETFTTNCKFPQVEQHFCQLLVPANNLQDLDRQKIQNPLLNSSRHGLYTSMRKLQVLTCKPTTDGTVSLFLYRAPLNGDLVRLQQIARKSLSYSQRNALRN